MPLTIMLNFVVMNSLNLHSEKDQIPFKKINGIYYLCMARNNYYNLT